MTVCTYAAIDNQGVRITGSLEAAGREDVIGSLVGKDLIVTKVACGDAAQDVKKGLMSKKLTLIPERITSETMMVFTRELATMVNAGLTLVESLYSLAEDMDNEKMKKVTQSLGAGLIQGFSFSEALRKYPDIFSKMYTNLVKVGEVGGNLDRILNSLAEYIEASENLKKKVLSAMYYPATIITFAFLVVSGLFIFIIPRFASIYDGFGAALPGPTMAFLNVAKFFQSWYWLIMILGAALGYGFFRFIRTPKGSMWFDKLKMTLPVLGPMARKVVIARFSRTLSLLYKSGIPIIDSLELVARSSGNSVVEKALLDAGSQVLEGQTVTETLMKSKVFPNMVIHMIDVGERTGTLGEMLNKISDFYDMQVKSAIAGLTSIIEPVLIVFMGVVIGVMAVALFLPIVKLPTLIMN